MHDREPWPARRARHERVGMAPIGRVGQLGETFLAHGPVRDGQQRRSAVPETRVDDEPPYPPPRLVPRDGAPRCQATGRREALEVVEKLGDVRVMAFDIDEQTLQGVTNRSGEVMSHGEAIHRWPKPHPLNASLERHRAAACSRVNNRGGGHRAPLRTTERQGVSGDGVSLGAV